MEPRLTDRGRLEVGDPLGEVLELDQVPDLSEAGGDDGGLDDGGGGRDRHVGDEEDEVLDEMTCLGQNR